MTNTKSEKVLQKKIIIPVHLLNKLNYTAKTKISLSSDESKL